MKKYHEVENPVWIVKVSKHWEVQNEGGDVLYKTRSGRSGCVAWCAKHNCQPVARIRKKKLSALRIRYNRYMARRALVALDAYPVEGGAPIEEKMALLMADMMHLSDWKKLDFDYALEQARMHHRAEVDPEDDIAEDGARCWRKK